MKDIIQYAANMILKDLGTNMIVEPLFSIYKIDAILFQVAKNGLHVVMVRRVAKKRLICHKCVVAKSGLRVMNVFGLPKHKERTPFPRFFRRRTTSIVLRTLFYLCSQRSRLG